MQAHPVDVEQLAGFDRPELAAAQQGGDLDDRVSETILALNRSARPLLLAGNGIRLSRAQNEFRELLDVLNIPLETTWLAIDLIGEDHPLFVGRPGSIAPRGANFAVQNSDFLLAIGARLDRVITGFNPETFAGHAHKVIVDIDPAELAKFGDSVHTKVCADAGTFIAGPACSPRGDPSRQPVAVEAAVRQLEVEVSRRAAGPSQAGGGGQRVLLRGCPFRRAAF